MICVGAYYCPCCKKYHDKHPEVPYIEIPKHVEDWNSLEGKAKKAITKLKAKGVPVLLNNEMTQILSYPDWRAK